MSTANPIDALRGAVETAVGAVAGGTPTKSRPTLERPKQADHGDYSTNAAMLLAPVVGAAPRQVAERLGDELSGHLGAVLDRVEVAGPGFLNLFLADAWYAAALAHVVEAGDGFGGGTAARPLKVNVEFVSANPTGPLTAASGRHAAYGDALARILAFAGHSVEREYYFNDAGSQVTRLGESIRARARGEDVSEDGYQGDYVAGLAAEIDGAADMDVDELARRGVEIMFARIRATLDRYRVAFDHYFLERELHDGDERGPAGGGGHVASSRTPSSAIAQAVATLEEAGHVYRHEDALWLRTTDFGDDKDRVLQRSSGEPTYFGADVAYMVHKMARGYDLMINVLGADHHGYIGRLKAAMATLGADPDRLEIPMLQFVHIVESGERASMSKRRGEFITLDDLISEIGVDATRFFMLQRSHDSTVDLDLDLARQESAENPVYYVQYAHARIASVLGKAGEERVSAALAADHGGLELHPSERALVKKLLAWPEEVAEAADRRAPHRVTVYALELAQVFTAFYRDCHVLDPPEGPETESFRLALSVAAQRTIARALDLLGVEAPASM